MSSGRHTRRVYIDGREFQSILSARIELCASSHEDYSRFSRALKTGCPYKGHIISYFPIKKEATRQDRKREQGAALLRGHETHRIGVYTDSRW